MVTALLESGRLQSFAVNYWPVYCQVFLPVGNNPGYTVHVIQRRGERHLILSQVLCPGTQHEDPGMAGPDKKSPPAPGSIEIGTLSTPVKLN